MKEKQKTILVTGGAVGVGKAICRRMASEGFAVGVADISREQAEQTAAELCESGANAAAFPMDTLNPAQVNDAFDAFVDRFGQIDGLVHAVEGRFDGSYQDMSFADWRRVMAVNMDATFLCTQRAAKEMANQSTGGKIIVILDQAAFTENADEVAYYTAKWGVRGYMRSLAAELSKYDITVNCVCPGVVWSERMEQQAERYIASTGNTRADYITALTNKLPLGRMQTAEDVAGMVSFLICEGNNITGQSLLVAGGMAMS